MSCIQVEKCEICGDFRRPNVSFFSDSDQTYNSKRTEEQKSRLISWLYSLIGFRKDSGAESKSELKPDKSVMHMIVLLWTAGWLFTSFEFHRVIMSQQS